ncbi:MAG: FAD-linked oxidase C-terminal domain-containing protein [Alphaproteobacteria bacterium]
MSTHKQLLTDQFRAFLPAESVLTTSEQLRPYECDGLPAYRQMPLLTVLPTTNEEVAKIMAICHDLSVPVVARGAATGLSGGALPIAGGVLLGLSKFQKILNIDPVGRTARVQAGVTNLSISNAAEAYGLYYAPDPSSQIACTIGGNVAENSGGVHCLKYGLTVHNILEVTMITPKGDMMKIGGGSLDAAGYDLMAILTGSEGMLGIVTEILVKLLPIPEHTKTLLIGFQEIETAANAVGDIIAAGIIPAGLEMMDGFAIAAADDYSKAGYPRDCKAILICELDGLSVEADAQSAKVEQLMRDNGASSVKIAKDAQERALFWKGRKSAFPAVGRISPDFYCMDGTVPRKQLAAVLTGIHDLSAHYGLRVANVFHAGDGNLHPLILYDSNDPDELHRAEQFGGDILELCVKAGGTITGEHGVGHEKLPQMLVQFSFDELEQFRALKAAFDPESLLNPGKVIPSLRKCSEYKALQKDILTAPSARAAKHDQQPVEAASR